MKKTTKTATGRGCAKRKTTATEKKAVVTAEKKVAPKAPVKTVTPTTNKVEPKPVEKPAAPKAVEKPAEKPAPVVKEPVAKKPEKKVTRIVAHVDVGWGNMLYIRGEGAGLSWEQGVPMICSDNGTEWHWIAETEDGPISFKFLINDTKWALGENVTINAGDAHLSDPSF